MTLKRTRQILTGASVVSFLVALASLLYGTARSETYDVVISQGRVMDPESGLDSIRNLGINGGKIRAISSDSLPGKQTVDARGLVVAPGFIDLHEHGQEPRNYQFQAHDGVTTSLELEAGTNDVAKWYAQREGKALINFGASAGYVPACMAVMHDTGTLLPRDEAVNRRPTEDESRRIFESVRMGLERRHGDRLWPGVRSEGAIQGRVRSVRGPGAYGGVLLAHSKCPAGLIRRSRPG